MNVDALTNLHSLDDVRQIILDGYRNTDRGVCLPLIVAEPAALIAQAVKITGRGGISGKDLRQVFSLLGAERYERGLKLAREAGTIAWTYEKRPNRAGRMQEQVIFRPTDEL